MLKRTFVLTALAAMVLCLGATRAPAADEDKSGLSDQQFVTEASGGGLAEVNMAQLALQNSTNPQVRQFAQRMLNDHTMANRQLNALADRDRLRPAPQMDRKHQEVYDHLLKLRGQEFDRAYAEAMCKDHDEDVSMFEKASKDLKNADLKQFASKTLDTLKEHKELAHKLADQLGVKTEGSKDRDRNRDKDESSKKR